MTDEEALALMAEQAHQDAERDDSMHVERLLDDFFTADTQPVTGHEEWLLRLCSTLMKREVEMRKRRVRPPRPPKGQNKGSASCS